MYEVNSLIIKKASGVCQYDFSFFFSLIYYNDCENFFSQQVQLISTLGSENDSVYTKKRVYSKINECSEMLSDFTELSKKTKTHNC